MDIFDKRDQYIGKNFIENYSGGIRRFHNLTIKDLQELDKMGCINPKSTHNDSPNCATIMNFMKKFSNYKITAHGFIEERRRDSIYLCIEGIEYKGNIDNNLKQEFTNMFRRADEFKLKDNELYCWYD